MLNSFYYTPPLASSDVQNGDEEVEDYLRAFDNNEGQNGGGPTFESLDEQISHEEIKRCIKQLSRNKSPGKDNLLNEYFMESIDLLRTSDGGNGNHSVSLPIILIKIKVNQMLPSSYISSLLVSIL